MTTTICLTYTIVYDIDIEFVRNEGNKHGWLNYDLNSISPFLENVIKSYDKNFYRI